MIEKELRWNMPLESRPILLEIGDHTHGREPEETFRLPDLWCIHFYRYEAELQVDGHPLSIRPGYVGITPPGSAAFYRFFGRSPHYYALFSLAPVGATFPVSAMTDLGLNFAATAAAFQEAIRFWPINRRRSEVRLWDILWQLSEISNADAPPSTLHPTIQQVIAYIDSHLHEQLRIKTLADEQELSHNHLTRLFHAAMGCSPMEYIQRRRLAQAKHLLIYTPLPIKTVAAGIGISDMQMFNKFIRRHLGASPRKLRQEELPKLGLLDETP